MTDATKRADATQRTLNEWKDRPFEWGKADCAKMASSHLRRFGHNPKIAKAGSYHSPLTAKAALKRYGHASLEAAIDAVGLERIGPAFSNVGDLALIEADHPMGCLCVCIGPNQWLALHEDVEGFTIISILEFITAWRVTWQKR